MESVRSDWTKLAKDFQAELYDRILNGKEINIWLNDLVVLLKQGHFDNNLVYRKRLRKDIDEYYAIGEKIVGRISNLMTEGNSIEETVKKLQRETKLSEDLIRYILKEQVMA